MTNWKHVRYIYELMAKADPEQCSPTHPPQNSTDQEHVRVNFARHNWDNGNDEDYARCSCLPCKEVRRDGWNQNAGWILPLPPNASKKLSNTIGEGHIFSKAQPASSGSFEALAKFAAEAPAKPVSPPLPAWTKASMPASPPADAVAISPPVETPPRPKAPRAKR